MLELVLKDLLLEYADMISVVRTDLTFFFVWIGNSKLENVLIRFWGIWTIYKKYESIWEDFTFEMNHIFYIGVALK